MKKIFVLLICFLLLGLPIFAAKDTASEEYLKGKHHLSFLNPFAENVAQRVVKKLIKKEAKGSYKVKFDGYTLSSMKKGVFKYLEVRGKNIVTDDVEIPYLKIYTVSDYNRIDYKQNPVVFKSDMIFDYTMHLSEKSINQALEHKDYEKVLQKVNKKVYPVLSFYNVRVRIRHDKLWIIAEYNFPIMPKSKNKTLMLSCDLKVDNGNIIATNVGVDNAYGNLPVEKLANLVNLLNPTTFTLDIIDDKKCNGNISNVLIEDNLVKINGRIYVKGDEK